ncbi:MAG: hypothetical protein SVZ03_13680 [Spirochaetota bacterium]|nr:hypothetical protein [Spirochaetota bacterium]
MRYIKNLVIFLLISVFFISCKAKKEMTLHDFLAVQEEILSSDLTPELEKSILQRHGYTIEQYRSFEENIENDPELKAKAGEMRLQMYRKSK